MQTAERWLTVQDIADRLQVHPETVREWFRTGRLRGILLSRKSGWRTTEEWLAEFMERAAAATPQRAAAAS